jgi:hypothetical protein
MEKDWSARLSLKSSFRFLIHTWLQPGGGLGYQIGNRLNGFPLSLGFAFTWLKPGVNETKQSRMVLVSFEAKPVGGGENMRQTLLALAVILTLFATGSTSAPQNARDPRYPAHWFATINDPNKPAWEILPQEAGPDEVILSKRNELGLLSNFAATPFVFHGKRYASLEGFWQSMLYPEGPKDPRAKFPGLEWKYTLDQVAAMTAFEAKHAGDLAEANMRKMGIGWVSFEGKRFAYRPATPGRHYRLIVAATWAKVNQNPEVRKVLLATGDLILKPDHHQEPNAPAAWRYFEIWMKIRTQLRQLSVDSGQLQKRNN